MMVTWFDRTKPYEAALINDLNQIIRIPSVLNPKTVSPQTPYGSDMVRALAKMEEFAKRDGFLFGRVDNQVTWIEYGPVDASETIGILTHIDVVAAGDGWTRDPFKPEILNGLYFGRGAHDMKADLMSAYYALKYLADNHIPVQRKIRLIIGTDEETGWRDIPAYFAQEGEPTMGFSPDGAFPVINAEKGFQTIRLRMPTESAGDYVLQRFIAGNRPNVLPGDARARISTIDNAQVIADFAGYLQQYPFLRGNARLQGDTVTFTVYGVQAHGAYPQDGENAGTYLANFLQQYPFGGTAQKFLYFVGVTVHDDPYATQLGLRFNDAEMGDLTLNVAMMRYSNHGQGAITLNIRYPRGITADEIMQRITDNVNNQAVIIEKESVGQAPHYVPEDDILVSTLSLVYAKQTGFYRQPRTSNGGSYARLLKRGVAFGGQFPDVPVSSHQANESTPVENLTKSMAIFAESLILLGTQTDS
ncbi:MAG: dipeptidase PepV [Lactobacillaceae bacterium]|nr:dipeptidase PepV [Lactobacillaceae bacterium]